MAKFQPPANLDFTRPEEWKEWKTRFERFKIASKTFKEDEEVQVSVLIYAMGPQAETVFSQMNLADGDEKKYAPVMAAFDKHFIPKKNVIHWRSVFHQRYQQDKEQVETYLRALYDLADKCDFTDKSEAIRDQFVIGICNKEVRKDLQANSALTLQIAVDRARQEEVLIAQVQAQSHTSSSMGNIDAISRYPRKNNYSKKTSSTKPHASANYRGRSQTQSSESTCGNCGFSHPPRKCSAYNQRCHGCNKLGHLQRVCLSSRRPGQRPVHRPAQQGEVQENDGDLFLGEKTSLKEEPPWLVSLDIYGTKVAFKVDTGADVTVVSEETFQSLQQRPKLSPVQKKLEGVGGQIKVVGMFECSTMIKGKEFVLPIYVVNGKSNLLSRSAVVTMGFITKNSIEELIISNSVFGQIGIMDTQPITIRIDADAVPYHVGAPRTVPFPLMPQVTKELEKMEESGIIMKITDPTDWCAPMSVAPKKSGDVRICVDLRRLNSAVKRESLTLPTLDDILPKLAEAKYFSSLDASKGYWQLPLSEESS